ncbi:MAG TPA: CopD family protein [Steroidobacteraceae bacterium]|nr:CopD family protein [Steroidobacteraceae bacterium]
MALVTSIDLISVVIRALGFMALFQAVGAGFFLALFGPRLTAAQPAIRRLGLCSAALGVLLVLAHLCLEAARLSGDIQGLWDPDLQRLAWSSRAGTSQIVQVIGLSVVLAGVWKPRHFGTALRVLGGLTALAAFLMTGHTRTHALHAVLAPLLALHLLVVAFWFGALLPLALAIQREPRARAAELLQRFSVVAGWTVPLIFAAGLAMAWLLAGTVAVVAKPYGKLLILKALLFGFLMALAAWNRWRLTPELSAGTASALRRSIAAEYLLIIAALSVTAVLTTFFSPE